MPTLTLKLVRLKQKLAAAERRETIIQQELAAAVANQTLTPYSGRGDLTTYYVSSFKDAELMIKVEVPTESFTKIFGSVAAGMTATGGVLTEPTNAAVADNKGFASHYYRFKFIHYKATPTAKLTKWGTRVVTYYDQDGDQAFREFPVGGTMNQIEQRYLAKVAAPGNFTRGIIQLISNTGDVIRSNRISPTPG